MEDCVTKLGPTVPEAPAVLPEEPVTLEDRTPAAPRPTFTRTYPVFGYE